MKTRLIRALSTVLTVAAVFAALPMQAFAAPEEPKFLYEVYLVDNKTQTVYDLDEHPIGDMLRGLELPERKYEDDELSTKEIAASIRVVDYRDYSSGIKNILNYDIRPDEIRVNGLAFTLSDEQFSKLNPVLDKITESAEEDYDSGYQYYALWPLKFYWEEISALEITVNGKTYTDEALRTDKDTWDRVKWGLVYNNVYPDSFETYPGTKAGTINAAECKITLKNGRVISILYDNYDMIYIESSNAAFGCEYKVTFSGSADYFRDIASGLDSPAA